MASSNETRQNAENVSANRDREVVEMQTQADAGPTKLTIKYCFIFLSKSQIADDNRYDLSEVTTR